MAGREMVLKKLRKSRLMQVQPSGWAGLGLGLGLGSGLGLGLGRGSGGFGGGGPRGSAGKGWLCRATAAVTPWTSSSKPPSMPTPS